jgi:hypothetical protein
VLLLHIKGYEWDFREGISTQAAGNLEAAFRYMVKILEHPETDTAFLDKLKLC